MVTANLFPVFQLHSNLSFSGTSASSPYPALFAPGLALAPLPLPHPRLPPPLLHSYLGCFATLLLLPWDLFSRLPQILNNSDLLQTSLCSKTQPFYSVQAQKMNLSKRFIQFPLFHHFINQETFRLLKTKDFCVWKLNQNVIAHQVISKHNIHETELDEINYIFKKGNLLVGFIYFL